MPLRLSDMLRGYGGQGLTYGTPNWGPWAQILQQQAYTRPVPQWYAQPYNQQQMPLAAFGKFGASPLTLRTMLSQQQWAPQTGLPYWMWKASMARTPSYNPYTGMWGMTGAGETGGPGGQEATTAGGMNVGMETADWGDSEGDQE